MRNLRERISCAVLHRLLAACFLVPLAAVTAHAEQTTGTPGSPSATTTIDGRYLPSPPPKFGGVINLGAEQSKPFWPPRHSTRA
jgi:hypothetical protein